MFGLVGWRRLTVGPKRCPVLNSDVSAAVAATASTRPCHRSLFNPNVLGLEHPYHYCIHLCFGLLGYYEQQVRACEPVSVRSCLVCVKSVAAKMLAGFGNLEVCGALVRGRGGAWRNRHPLWPDAVTQYISAHFPPPHTSPAV